jgi:MoxR-like ATPase
MSDWLIYNGKGKQHDGIGRLPEPPDWRLFEPISRPPIPVHKREGWSDPDWKRGSSYRADGALLNPVNAALYLRRPLLVTGRPGVGKSTLAQSVAFELGLGPVLRWPITSSSQLRDGLYIYDAIGRLQDVHLNGANEDRGEEPQAHADIGRYIRLGPLGTALLPRDTPRVLLIDEIDKASLDLPNDLLSTFEVGEFQISELVRLADKVADVAVSTADVPAADQIERVGIHHGLVRSRQFPLIIMTSNGERQFPTAFLRRCLSLKIEDPELDQLVAMVEAQLGPEVRAQANNLIQKFHQLAHSGGELANDQLLNAIQLACCNHLDQDERNAVIKLLLRPLNEPA